MLSRLTLGQACLLLAVVLAATLVVSAGIGAFVFTPQQMFRYAGQALGLWTARPADELDANVFLRLRMPRVLLCGLTGAVLGVSGTMMQGLFRNPIVEPGLAGTSAGAALGAALVIVLGGTAFDFTAPLGAAAVPVCAFLGGMAATLLVYRLSTRFGRTEVLTLLLAGIAVNALCNAGTGFLSYSARDPQARNITFWNLGTFTTADWPGVGLVALAFMPCFALALRQANALNALMLGEDEAAYLGIKPRSFVLRMLVINTIMVSVATSMVGVIAFVGLVVPHALRLMRRSSDHRFLLPASALLGAIVLEIVDIIARLAIQPAELPIGIITALIGAPVFLWLLLQQRPAHG